MDYPNVFGSSRLEGFFRKSFSHKPLYQGKLLPSFEPQPMFPKAASQIETSISILSTRKETIAT